jgi:GDPmannose 4,6-dehydratase
MKRAMIIGSAGQDGRLLLQRLARDGCKLVGITRAEVHHDHLARNKLGLPIEEPDRVDILDRTQVDNAIRIFSPNTIFYLAAHHHASEDAISPDIADLYLRSHDVHVRGLLNVLEAVKNSAPEARLFYAASSHCFGDPPPGIQDETTPFRPLGAYGITKTTGVQLCRMYRSDHAVRASCGILYNHESPLRRSNFLSTKIVRAAVEISRGLRSKLVLGDLLTRVDWGYAPDYIEAMIAILRLETADDFIIATGETHSVEEFVLLAFSHLGLDWSRHVEVDQSLINKRHTELIGDSSKLRARTGWSPSVSFAEMVRLLVDAELRRNAS